MVRATSEKIGRGKCPHCGEPVTYRRSAGGYLTHKCEACDSSGYAEPGGTAYKARMATIDQRPQPVPEDEEKPAATPAPKAARKGFALGDV